MIGTKLAHYEILSLLGKGGMGEVFRARDPRLDREVAIKVLPRQLVENADARARFEREAKAVAALSHPNILAIHDFGEHEGTAYAVTELLEGHTLQEELSSGAIPLRRTLEIAVQVADGLAAAHDRGIVHRDIKPANIFLTPDGRTKILDFGLAKAGLSSDDKTLAAEVVDSTRPGTVLGTVRYMSPEQVRAAPVDHRSDIFSFGTLLWEMLSGQPAFDRDSAVETMNAILKEDPPELTLREAIVPATMERILHRCLEKAPGRRFQSAQDLAFALRNVQDSSSRVVSGVDIAPPVRASRVRPVLVGVGLLLVGVVAGYLLGGRGDSAGPRQPLRIVNITQSGLDFGPSASPDGKTIAFVSQRDGTERIWLRQLQGGVEVPLTEGRDLRPQFSPDGSSLLFHRMEPRATSAYRIATVGGSPRKLLDNISEACWSPSGEELGFIGMAGTSADPIMTVGIHDLRSGATRELHRAESQLLYGLSWSPDGRFLSATTTAVVLNTNENNILLVDTTSGATREAFRSGTRLSSAAWSPDARSLVLAQSTSLLGDISGAMGLAMRLDPFGGGVEPLFWVESVWAGAVDYMSFDFIGDGSLVFDEILWQGNLVEVGVNVPLPIRPLRELTQGNSRDRQPAYSPDGSKIIFSSNRSGNLDLWTLTPATGEIRQVTADAKQDWDPAFTVDGSGILWSSDRSGQLEIWIARADGSAARQLTRDGVDAENPTQSPDGEWVYYGSAHPERRGIWRIRTDGSEEELIAAGSYLIPEVSPDGRHVVFNAIDPEDSITRIHVVDTRSLDIVMTTEVPARGFQRIIAAGRPRWMPDGQSLVFVGSTSERSMGLLIQDFRPGEDTLATRRVLTELESKKDIESFGISPDGQRITISVLDHTRTLRLAEKVFADSR